MRVLWIALTLLAALGHCYALDPEGTPAADGAPPKQATGEIVNGVRCSLAADPDVFLKGGLAAAVGGVYPGNHWHGRQAS